MNIDRTGRKYFYNFCVVLFFLFMTSGCTSKFTIKTESISGKVVDAETNEPIEDVIVIGYWPGYTFYLHVSSAPTVEVLEAVTDRNGNYFIPGWLKKNIDRTFRYGDPHMIFYKTGYEIEIEKNAFAMKKSSEIPGYFHPWKGEWDGQTIKMKKFKGDNRAYREYLNFEQYSTSFKPIFNYCKYMNVPRLLIAMEEYYQTQPDYWVPGRTLTIGEIAPVSGYRTTSQSHTTGRKYEPDKLSQEEKPLPSILTITQLENIGSRCEITPVEYLKRISSNEKDFIRSSDRTISTKN